MTQKWKIEDNRTLIEIHSTSSYNRILYRKAGNLFKYINKIVNIVSMISSSIALSFIWINDNDNDNDILDINSLNNASISILCNEDTSFLKILLSFNFISIFSQNVFNFNDISNEYLKISKLYGNIQYGVEIIGDIHPKKRNGEPKYLLPNLRYKINKLNQNSKEVSKILSFLLCYTRKNNIISYLSEKHERYNSENVSDDDDIDEHYSFDRLHSNKDINLQSLIIDQ